MVTEPIALQDYENFRDFLEQSCGIVLGENKHYLVNSRLNRLMGEIGVASLGDLVKRLNDVQATVLRARIVDAMTTNETYWFRDIFPFDIFKQTILAEYGRQKRPTIRVWSAACSSGQEPYSLAMGFKEYQLGNPGAMPNCLEVHATDISPSMLKSAGSGRYDAMAMARGLSEERKQRFFKERDGAWELSADIRAMVEFREHNLLQNYSLLGRFDLIYCRNVLIYFSPDSKRDILARMAATLNPGGYLLLGASESIASYSDQFEMVRCNPGVIYRLK